MDSGSSYSITFENYKVTKNSDKSSVILNGVKTFKNVSGGLVKNLTPSSAPVVFSVRGSLSITFADGSTRAWGLWRKKTYTRMSNNSLDVKIESDTLNNIVEIGYTRANDKFVNTISTPLEASQTCGWRNLIAGVRTHTVVSGTARTFTTTFGLDASGNAVTGGNCPTSYKVDWVNAKGESKMALITRN
jgi:hypothetical protein